MRSVRPSAGQALALTSILPARPDPLALYAGLAEGGTRGDSLLLERSVGPTLLLDQAAVRIECRGANVTLEALTPGGELVLETVRQRLATRVVLAESRRLVLHFPASRSDDAEKRLLAPSPLDALRALLAFDALSPEEPLAVALLGVVAFDQVDLFEDLPANPADPLDFPDHLFWLAESLVVIEPGGAGRLVCTVFGSDDKDRAERSYQDAARRLSALQARCSAALAAPAPTCAAGECSDAAVEVDLDDADFASLVSRLREQICAGEVFQVVPSRTFRAPCPDPLGAFARLRGTDPSPYQFFVRGPRHVLFGASPETSVRVVRDEGWKTVEVKPIAGTRPRGATADEDDRYEADLRLDQKELAEHMMLVDLGRNDIAQIAISGTRRVNRLMSVERYARVMHLVSSVTGRLKIGLDALDALRACLNVGTLSGAPKIRATELLRTHEQNKRGPYGGAIGWLDGTGSMDMGVVIRSAVVMDGIAYVRAGAGVVYDSDPQAEAEETRRKASAVLSALALGGKAA